MHNGKHFLGGLALLLCLFPGLPVAAAQLAVTDASSHEPLDEAVIEILHSQVVPTAGLAHQVIQRDATFHPHVSVVPIDSRVEFPNHDTTRHHVFSFSPAKVFELELYLQETPPPIHFDQPGVVVLGCNIHDHMQAFIVVSDAAAVALTGPNGQAEFPDLPPGEHRLRIWHPRLDDTHQTWWEGEISAGESLTVALDLQASLPTPQEPSALQQHFWQALQESKDE
ncbi:Cupredoxin [Halomonas campisalis]|uniref:Cupredoxin n=1 Tax=Billgrantia campisalis TaxID=74661 RepID=A0ABS9PAK3_9GAMM|nr:carboxypeptidase regulatory-like domain-containing protein [Halomonas campisalis]MCG6658793.1 Cupredoxin [Halomonas campisalis]MDR5864756.1 carboxypeptidase regulatory-like domain-containing protein [Halomonas campisalis]